MEYFRTFRKGFKPTEKSVLLPFEINHLKSVRLFAVAKEVEIFDGQGKSYFYKSLPSSKDLEIMEGKEKEHKNPQKMSLGGGIPKGNRLDFLLQKVTELGVTELYFFPWERSVREEFNPDRVERILVEACIQSGRTHLPEIFVLKNWKELLEKFSVERIIVLHPYTDKKLEIQEIKDCLVLIGPEGGLGKEVEEMKEAGIGLRSVGDTILRMETAYLYAASLLRQTLI